MNKKMIAFITGDTEEFVIFKNKIVVPPPEILKISYFGVEEEPKEMTIKMMKPRYLEIYKNIEFLIYNSDIEEALIFDPFEELTLTKGDFNFLKAFKLRFRNKITGLMSVEHHQKPTCYRDCGGTNCFKTGKTCEKCEGNFYMNLLLETCDRCPDNMVPDDENSDCSLNF
ncbi:hypothetical protein MHBO_001267 [Bonamia ostreae]|uniref:Uncharacterized protein n=1 Tax=Bonamia ostreae TaxID=126728 RepID=A0ABV2AIC1_9EUKA